MAVAKSPAPSPDQIDLSGQAFWHQPAEVRDAAFAVLRRERPVAWQRAPESVMMGPDFETTGYWAVTRYDDVRAVSRDPSTFCSGEGVMFEDAPPELLEASISFLGTDAPRHTKLRGLVSAAFTPRQIARIEARIAELAREIVDELAPRGECDFVEQVSRRLPMATISELMGVPDSMRDEVVRHADELVGWNDPDVLLGRDALEMNFQSIIYLTGVALELADHRAEHPADDLMTALVQAEVDGDRLLPEEIGAFFVLLSVAGNDTTRHTTSHGLRALTHNPDQRRLLLEDVEGRVPLAVEEMIRWATAVMTFRRTATRDTELHGQPIAAGEKVVLFYTSANRDEEAFDQPERFDVLRDPNHHVGFGGGGPHYCLGASLARTQLRCIFSELLTRLPDIEAGEPEYLMGNFINGIKRMPCRFTSRAA
ncbi:MAG: cytochrome P450 [Thermoleophilaceae bacterium]